MFWFGEGSVFKFWDCLVFYLRFSFLVWGLFIFFYLRFSGVFFGLGRVLILRFSFLVWGGFSFLVRGLLSFFI